MSDEVSESINEQKTRLKQADAGLTDNYPLVEQDKAGGELEKLRAGEDKPKEKFYSIIAAF